jgi:Xaa-Pro aminopeptidase
VVQSLREHRVHCLITPPFGPAGPSASSRYLSASDGQEISCLLDADGELQIVGPSARSAPWGTPVETTEEQLPVLLGRLIRERYRDGAAVGVVGLDANGGNDDDCCSLAFVHTLQESIPAAKLVDCSAMLRDIRARKSQEEVAVVALAVQRAEQVLQAAARALRPGRMEHEAWTDTVSTLEKLGSTPPHRVRWGTAVRPVLGVRPTHQQLHRGFMALTEVEASANGYRVVIPQTFGIQVCDAGLIELYARYPEFWERALLALQPGTTIGEVASACTEIAREIAPAEGRLSKGDASVVLHGCGLGYDLPWVTSAPELDRAKDQPIEIGQVFSFAPTLRAQIARRTYAATWGAVVEITTSGPRRLGTLPPRLWITNGD